MKEVAVRAWCDGCAADIEVGGEGTVDLADREVTIAIGAGGPRLLDLCERHEKALVEPLRALLADVGQDATVVHERPGNRRGTKPAHPDRFPCLWCSETFAALGGYFSHVVREHGLPEGSTSGSVYGKRCPLCGKGFSTVPSLGTHGRIVHGSYSIAMSFVMARDAGDPHKLVTRVARKGKP